MNNRLIKKLNKAGIPLDKPQIESLVLGQLRNVPVTVLNELLAMDFVYKSPYSASFYSKPKDWKTTLDNTIRYSDHWNFLDSHNPERMHCPTDVRTQENLWAKGIWSEKKQEYTIVQTYHPTPIEQYAALKESIVAVRKQYEQTPEFQAMIGRRVKFFEQVKSKSLSIIIDESQAQIVKWKLDSHPPYIKIADEHGVEEKLPGRPLLKGKAFVIITKDGQTIDGQELLKSIDSRHPSNKY